MVWRQHRHTPERRRTVAFWVMNGIGLFGGKRVSRRRSCPVDLLPRHQLREQAVVPHQFLVGAILADAALIHHDDPVAQAYRGQPVGHDDAGDLLVVEDL